MLLACAFLCPLPGAAQPGVQVGVAEGEHRAVEHGPAVEQRACVLEVDDGAVVRRVKRVAACCQRAIRLFRQYLDLLLSDIAPLPVVVVLQRIVRVELQLVQAEAIGVGHGVGPGDILGEADGDEGYAVQGGAGHVVDARNSEVRLVPGAIAEPRLVGIAQQHAATVFGRVAAQRQAVTAEVADCAVRRLSRSG